MSAHWWELWSPGLQAVGGLVELVGVWILAYEWWQTGNKFINMKLQFEEIRRKSRHLEWTAEPYDKNVNKILIKVRKKLCKALKGNDSLLERLSDSDVLEWYYISNSRVIYIRGFFLVVIGVLMQIGANGIAWGAGYGLLN